MADVPDQAVGRSIEDMMKRHRQLDHAQSGAQMAASYRDRVDRLDSQLIRQLPELIGFQLPDLRRSFTAVEQRSFAGSGQYDLLWSDAPLKLTPFNDAAQRHRMRQPLTNPPVHRIFRDDGQPDRQAGVPAPARARRPGS